VYNSHVLADEPICPMSPRVHSAQLLGCGVGFLGFDMRTEKQKMHHQVHKKVRRAIDAGKLVREPCEVCGNTKSEGHHEDYSKPLDVVWLCRKHHVAAHTRCKFTNEIILGIASSKMTEVATAKKFNVGKNTVWRIKSGRIYSEVTGIIQGPPKWVWDDRYAVPSEGSKGIKKVVKLI